MDSLGRNITLPIYNADGTSFHGLELKKFTFDSVVMALGDKITGELYYPSNTLSVNQTEYVVYDGVKYYLINPPTIVKEGMKADNGTAKGMTKYSFTFYHPMFMLYNFPFTDVAVTSSEEKYKSQDKIFFWIGNLVDYVAKLNKNLQGTEWVVEIGSNVPVQDKNKLSEVLSFNDQKIADALKTGYDTWEIPYIIDIIASTDSRYAQGKRFLIRYGLPSQEILVENAQHQLVPYVFQMGQGVGLKNDSRTPKNNKIVTRIAGYGSEDNVPFGYPQIIWTGDQTWNYTINNSASAANSYPIYDGIVAGQRVRLIHHPFTRSHLMPTIYADTVNKKVNPYATGYDPTIEIKDYYDAVNDSSWTYPNQIISNAPSYEIHEFSDIKPELGEKFIVGAEAFNGDVSRKYMTVEDGVKQLNEYASETNIQVERLALHDIAGMVDSGTSGSGSGDDPQIYWFEYEVRSDAYFTIVTYASSNINFILEIHRNNEYPSAPWDDSMDDDGNYKQSYFRVTLPSLGFDLYACAAVTQEMKINMRSGSCLGCSFPVEVDWEDYKKNFYDSDGKFAPYGQQRNFTKYPNSTSHEITVICKKELETFGTLMPNIYQQPAANDKFVILGISLPQSYITSAQTRLDNDMKQYMLDNNVHYFEYPLKFDEYFLANHTNILAQMKPNILVRFNFASEQHELYIKQLSVKYGEKVLPQYNITLTDDVEIVLSPIGRVTDEVSSLRVLFGSGGGSSEEYGNLKDLFLSKKDDDTAAGMIRFLRGLQVGEEFVTGLLGEGGIFRVDDDGTTYLECDKLYVRMRAYFDTVEVKKYLHSGGNRIASKAGIWCSRVEWLDSDGEITTVLSDAVKFRCYFRATSENGREITNDFVVNDLAFCKETNVDATSVDQHGYWRCVIAVSSSPTEDGEHWIDLSKTDCQTGSDVPIAQDDIVQLGHKTDTTRQGAIIEYVGGEDAPAYQIYQGINSYSLTGKNYVRFGYDSQSGGAQAYIGNPDGSTYLWYHYVTEGGQTFPRLDIKANVQFTSPITHQDTTIEDFAGAVTDSIEDLQEQIDGEIDTWFYEGTPTLNNAPANEWTTATEKERHLGDLYYDIGTGATGGFAYRFIKDENNVYQWQYLEDTAITEALAKAAEAYDLADHKRRVFYTTPTPPYDNGDLWVNAVWPASGASQGETYNDDILRCVTSKSATGTFSISDWTLASNYTDDSALVDFVTNTYAQDLENLETQIDGKAETWYQDSDPSTAWTDTDTKVAHVGDIWYDTSANGGKKTYIWRDRGEGQSNRFYWAEQAVPDDVFDEIDGKAAIYVEWGAWINQTTGENELKVKDLFIPSSDTTQGGVAYKANKVYRCTNASTPTFQEIRYTDDSKFDGYINQILNGSGASGDSATVANALRVIKGALNEGTEVDGGLVLTSLIGLRSSSRVWAGISGQYQATETGTGYKGHGIAAWFGGAMVDKEVTTSATDFAKTLFRMDGTGYLAGGNIKWGSDGSGSVAGGNLAWNAAGNITYINGQAVQVNGSDVLTAAALADYLPLSAGSTKALTGDLYISNNKFIKWLDSTNAAKTVLGLNDSNTLTLGYDTASAEYGTGIYGNTITFGYGTSRTTGIYLNASGNVGIGTGSPSVKLDINGYAKTTRLYLYKPNSNDTGAVYIEYDSTNSGMHLVGAGFYSDSYVSALGQGSSGGGGGISLNEPLLSINQAGLSAPTYNGSVLVYSSGWKYSYNAAIVTSGLTSTGSVSANGFYVTGKNDTYVLLAGGGTKLLSEIGGSGSVVSVSINGTSYSPDANGDVNLGSGYLTGYTDTKTTAGISQSSSKLYIIGSTQTSATAGSYGTTYTNTNCYIGTDGCLYSGSTKVLTGITSTLVTTALGFTPAASSDLANYLPKTGGTISSSAISPLTIISSRIGSVFTLKTSSSDTDKGTIEYYDSNQTHGIILGLYRGDNFNYVCISSDGVFKYNNNQVFIHSGNWTSYIGTSSSPVEYATKAVEIYDYKGGNGGYFSSAQRGLGTSYTGALVLSYGNNPIYFYTNTTCKAIITGSGNVGIGKSSPSYKLDVNGSIFGSSFIKDGGTSSQFLKADGSLDTNTYLTSASLSDYVTKSTAQTISGVKTFSSGKLEISHATESDLVFYSGNTEYMYLGSYTGYGYLSWQTSGLLLCFLHKKVGVRTSSPSYTLDVNGSIHSNNQLVLSVASGIPISVTSTTMCTNLNADMLDGNHASYFGKATDVSTLQGYFTNGSANTALKLNTAVNLWGRSFDGSSDISGTLTATSITCDYITKGTDFYVGDYSHAFGGSTKGLALYVYSGNLIMYHMSKVGIGTKSPAYMLDVAGTFYASGNSSIGGTLGVTGAATLSSTLTVSGNVGIGTTSPSYKLHVAGDIYATGGVTALSDEREKNVIGSTNLTVEDVAMMKAVNYRWKDGRDNVQHVGSIAQDWQRVLPEVVMRADDEKGTLSLQYGVAALVSSIVTARKVVDHERRIAELERENRELKEKLKIA